MNIEFPGDRHRRATLAGDYDSQTAGRGPRNLAMIMVTDPVLVVLTAIAMALFLADRLSG